jgi:hypothetical protein
MAVSPQRLYGPAQLTTSAVAIVTSPANTKTTITNCSITNAGSGAITYTIHIVPSGDTADSTNIVADAQSLSEGTTEIVSQLIGAVLLPGDSLQALAGSATSLNIYVAGYQVS